jgi:hypothetical protein
MTRINREYIPCLNNKAQGAIHPEFQIWTPSPSSLTAERIIWYLTNQQNIQNCRLCWLAILPAKLYKNFHSNVWGYFLGIFEIASYRESYGIIHIHKEVWSELMSFSGTNMMNTLHIEMNKSIEVCVGGIIQVDISDTHTHR